jgi:hypothetical protein
MSLPRDVRSAFAALVDGPHRRVLPRNLRMSFQF